jgi:hypothetical protein
VIIGATSVAVAAVCIGAGVSIAVSGGAAALPAVTAWTVAISIGNGVNEAVRKYSSGWSIPDAGTYGACRAAGHAALAMVPLAKSPRGVVLGGVGGVVASLCDDLSRIYH